MTDERSGIDILKELLFKVENIEKRLSVLDTNIKIIANSARVSEIADRILNTPLEDFSKGIKKNNGDKKIIKQESGFKNFKLEAANSEALELNKGKPLADKNRTPEKKRIMVNGKLTAKGSGGKVISLPGVDVKIFDRKDNLVKETKTNRGGSWIALLEPGDYVALFEGVYNSKKLVPQNKNFKVPEKLPEGQASLEIT